MEPPRRTSESGVWIAVLVLIVVAVVFGSLYMMSGGTMMGGGIYPGGAWVLGFLVMLVIIALVGVALAVGFAPRTRDAGYAPPYPPHPPAPPSPPNAVQILDARYARGEITRDEYLRMRQDLERPQP